VSFTVMAKRAEPGALAIDLALCAFLAVWMLWMATLHPGWRNRPILMAVFMAGLIAVTAVLVVRDPWFGFFAPACYFFAFRTLPWPWELAGIAGVAVVAGTAQASGIAKSTPLGLALYGAVLVVNVVPMCGLAWLGWNTEVRSRRREQALDEVNDANRRLEAALAENAGLHRQLLDQAREAGMLDERQRMAREIHDTLAQGLTGIITQLQAAEHASDDPAGWQRHVSAAVGLARESLSEARRSVHELRPKQLESARLTEAVAEVAARWSQLHGIPAQVTETGPVRPIPPEAEVALLRAAQEALANVANHAQASRVWLTVSYLDHEVALDVRDDGDGFDPAHVDIATASAEPRLAGGFGLVAMRERIERMSGTLQIESEPGAGTAISARVPLTTGGRP
jgi:signal transduction histidine kinase